MIGLSSATDALLAHIARPNLDAGTARALAVGRTWGTLSQTGADAAPTLPTHTLRSIVASGSIRQVPMDIRGYSILPLHTVVGAISGIGVGGGRAGNRPSR